MALFRCEHCKHTREAGNEYINKKVKCPKCGEAVFIYDTVKYIKSLIKKNEDQAKKLQEDKEIISEIQIIENTPYSSINIYNTKSIAHPDQYWPIEKWCDKNKIQCTINHDANDTTGFFDEIALLIGNNFKTLKFVSDQIKYNQSKGYKNVNIDLSKKNKNETKQIKSFCKEMYDYSFVSRYYDEPKEQKIRLVLQTAAKIKTFFNGDWMEWFIFMKLLEFFKDYEVNASTIRSLEIEFEDTQRNELDILFLINENIPFCIECKSGEFRGDIDKYLKLRKKLNIPKEQFIICAFGLSQDHTQGLTTMYNLTFTNEMNFIDHINKVIKNLRKFI